MSKIKIFGQTNGLDTACLSQHQLVMDEKLGVLSNLDTALSDADGFVILPHADPLMSLSLLVAKQYNKLFANKPVVILHSDEYPSPYVGMTRTMRDKGVVPQAEESLYTLASDMHEVEAALKSAVARASASAVEKPVTIVEHAHPNRAEDKKKPDFNVCILGSYSTQDPAHIETATQLGEMLHRNQWGLIYGGSDKGMLKAFAEAASGPDKSGYVKAIIPEIYLWSGLDAEFHNFIDDIDVTSDIYVRMQHMAKQSDVFVAAPGGFGTAQEIAAFLHIKNSDPAQRDKPLILMNGDGFWNDIVRILHDAGYKEGHDFISANNVEQVEQLIQTQKSRPSF